MADATAVLMPVKIADPTTPSQLAAVDASNNLQVILAANSGVDIGDVDVTSLPNLNETVADDAAFTVATDRVFPVAGMADDTTPDSVDEGDAGILRMSLNRNLYMQIRDGAGNERGANVNANSRLEISIEEDNAGIGGGEEITDDAAFTPGTSKVRMAGFTFDDTTPDSVDEGDAGAARMSANRNIYMNIRDAAGNERGANVDASNNLNVILAANDGVDVGDVDVTSVVPGTGATNLGKAEDAAHTTGDTGVFVLTVRQDTAAALSDTDGDYQGLITDNAGRLHVTDPNAGEGVPGNPAFEQASGSAAAGATVTVQQTTDEGGNTRELRQVTVSASVPFKAVVEAAENGSATTTFATLFAPAGGTVQWQPSHPDFTNVTFSANAGFDGFQVTFTNLDSDAGAIDHYAAFEVQDG